MGSLSDKIGRKATYACFFTLGTALYALVPAIGHTGSVPLYVACFCVILTMYGGGFATIPAYLADIFGPKYVSAVHGRLLTAWSVAGVLGPVLVNYIREAQIAPGVPKYEAYNVTMYIMAGLLVTAFFANLAVKAVPDRTANPPLTFQTPNQPGRCGHDHDNQTDSCLARGRFAAGLGSSANCPKNAGAIRVNA